MQVYNAMHYVYRHIRLDTGQPFYIGMGKDPGFKRAYSKRNRNTYWLNITNSTNYRVDIMIENLNFSEACVKEKEFITLYGKLNNGLLCNMTDGGEGLFNPTDEIRKKLSVSKQGADNPQFGKKWSEEKKKERSKQVSGKNNPNYGHAISKEQKLIIGNAQKGRQKSIEEKEAIYSKTRIKVLNTETGFVYDSIKDLAEAFGIPDYKASRWIKTGKKNLIKLR